MNRDDAKVNSNHKPQNKIPEIPPVSSWVTVGPLNMLFIGQLLPCHSVLVQNLPFIRQLMMNTDTFL